MKKKATNLFNINKEKLELEQETLKKQITHSEELMKDVLETFVKPDREG